MIGNDERCECESGRAGDGSEYALCNFCDQQAIDEQFGDRDMLNELHANPQPEGYAPNWPNFIANVTCGFILAAILLTPWVL